MQKKLFFYVTVTFFGFTLFANEAPNRLAAKIGGFIPAGPILIFEAGASYERVVSTRLAVEVEAVYNFMGVPLGRGPSNGGGLDAAIEAMVWKFGERNFSKGFVLSAGIGAHYIQLYHIPQYPEDSGEDPFYFVFPVNTGAFYYHLFENNWFLKTGIKFPFPYAFVLARDGGKVVTEALIGPTIFIALGYAF